MTIIDQIHGYIPYNEQEEKDQTTMLKLVKHHTDLFTRENETAHFTASAWIVNASRTKVLMVYHNLYNSWSWTGGHADGDEDLLQVALREAVEETGISNIKPIKEDIFSLEIATVDGHMKKGRYVSSHLHLNVTFLLVGDENDTLAHRPEENSAVAWFDLEAAVEASTEP